eukprot:CAMPEP_0177457056 /NCGR_PEP_ID=MMETSP0369-20130122/12775_1 /TAXON_ID=447022 ORGANISM="Scrippsiella hangoei-like, Strain SHHI-4" /NCGR_SAMPLE_ID=MMETSP0369 /ASSEMBLY_ACC=CAM_ASM_000364 /LENGTH=124 /DNA_ID=CAMNT_0018930045 /DNA_START=448 /DNA_END=822 /DNA_ORIENTATION=+
MTPASACVSLALFRQEECMVSGVPPFYPFRVGAFLDAIAKFKMSFSKSIASHGQNSCFVAASFTNSAGPKELRHGRGSCGGNAEGRLLTLGPSMDGSGSHNLATDLQPTRKAHSVPVIKCRKAR